MAGVMMEDTVPLSYYSPYLMHAGQVPNNVMSRPSGTFCQHSVAPQPVFVANSAPYEHPQYLQQSRRGQPIYRVIPKQDENRDRRPLYGTAPIDRNKVDLQEAFRQALSQQDQARASRGQQLHQFAPGFVNAPPAYPAYIVPAAPVPLQSSNYQVNHENRYPIWRICTPAEEPQLVPQRESVKKTSTVQPTFGVFGDQQPQPILTPQGLFYGQGMPSSTLAQRSLQGEVPTLVASDSVPLSQSAASPRLGWNVFPVDSPVSHSSKAAAPLNISEETTPVQQRQKTAEVTAEDEVAASKAHDQLMDYLSVLFLQAKKERLQKAAEEAPRPAMASEVSPADPKKQESKKQESSPPTSSHRRVIKVIPVLDAAAKNKQKEVLVQRTVSKEVVKSGDEAQQENEKVSVKKEEKKTSMDSETAAKKIQSVYRGYIVRRSQPLKHLRDIARVRSKLRDVQSQSSNQEALEKRCRDPVERLKVTEGIMGLLLQLDSIQGVDPVVRDIRKSTAREVLRLQDLVDSTIVCVSNSAQPVSEDPIVKKEKVDHSTQEDQNRKVDEEKVENISSIISEVVETIEQQSGTAEEKPVTEAEAIDVKSVEKVDVALKGTLERPKEAAEVQDEPVDVLIQKLLKKLKPEERLSEALTKDVKNSFAAKGPTSVRAKLVTEILNQLSLDNEKPMAEETSANITEDVLLSHVGCSVNLADNEPAQPPSLESDTAVKSDGAPLYEQGKGSSLCSKVLEDQTCETSAAFHEDTVSEEANFASEALDGRMNVVTSGSVSKADDGLGVGSGIKVRDDEVTGEDKVASMPIMGEKESITNRDVEVGMCDFNSHAEQQLELLGEEMVLPQESVSSSLEEAHAEQPLESQVGEMINLENGVGLALKEAVDQEAPEFKSASFTVDDEGTQDESFAVQILNVEMPLEQPADIADSLQHVINQLRGEHFPGVENVQAEPEMDLAESRGTNEDSSNKDMRSMKISNEIVLENPLESIDVSSPKKFTEKIRIPAPAALGTETLQEVGNLNTSSPLKGMRDSLRALEASSQKSETGLTLTQQLIEENKKLKALLGDVLKWSQWQGSATLGLHKIMERLEIEVLESKETNERFCRKKKIVKKRR